MKITGGLNFLKSFLCSEPTENYNQPACEDRGTISSSKLETMALPGKESLQRKRVTRIGPPDQPPDEYPRGSAHGYKPGHWETGETENYGSQSTHTNNSIFTAKGNVPSNFTLPRISKNSNAAPNKTVGNKLFTDAVGSTINQNQNPRSSSARTRNSYPQQGPSGSSEQQRRVSIRGRGKGKEMVNNRLIDLTNDEDPIEQFSDLGDPPTNFQITRRPIQSSSKADDPLLLHPRSRHNAQVEIKGYQHPQANSHHHVERQHLSSQGKVPTKYFIPERMYIWAEEGVATLPFPGACASSRLYVEGNDIIFEGQLPIQFEMRFRAQDIEEVFTQVPPKQQRFGLQLKAEFIWRQRTSPCGLTKQPPGWSLPSSGNKKIIPAPPGLVLFELALDDTRASEDALALLFNTLKRIRSLASASLTTSLDQLWKSWLPSSVKWQKPAPPPPSNNLSCEGDHMSQTSDSDGIEIRLQDGSESRGLNHFKAHRPSIDDTKRKKLEETAADGPPTGELECYDSEAKDRPTDTYTHFTPDQLEGHGLELEDKEISSLSTLDQSDGRGLHARDIGTSVLSLRDELMNAQPPSKFNQDRITKSQPQSKGASQLKLNTLAINSPIPAKTLYPGRPTTRSSTREKADTPTATLSKPIVDDHPIEPPKPKGKRSHHSATVAAHDPQQKSDSDIVLVWPFDGEKSTNSVAITHADMRRLEEGEFLNDTLIEFGLKWELGLLRQTRPKVCESIHMFNSFFFHKLSRKSKKKLDVITESKIAYEGVRKWTKGHDLFTKDFVVIPINEHMHWYFMIVVNPGKILDAKPPSTTAPLNRTTRSRSSVASMAEANQSPSVLLDDEADQLEDSPHFAKEEASTKTGDQPPMDVEDPTLALGQMNLDTKEDQDMLTVEQNDSSGACVLTLDSLATGSHKAQAKTILRYFINEAKAKRSTELAYELVDHIPIIKVSVPEQPNFCDCGLYLIHAFKTFFENTDGMMTWIRANSLRKKKSDDLDWAKEVRRIWFADAAQIARQNMKFTVEDFIPDYQKHVEAMKQKKLKERISKDLSTSNATQPKAGLEGIPPKGSVSAIAAEFEKLSSQQPANSRRPSSSDMGVDTARDDEDVQCLDPPIKPPEQLHTPFRASTSNSSTIKRDGLPRQKKRRRLLEPCDDNSEESRVQTNQMNRHGHQNLLDFDTSSKTRKHSGDISMSEATVSPGEGAQRPNEATKNLAIGCEHTSSLTPISGLSGPIDHDQTMDLDGVPLESSDTSPPSLQNKSEPPPPIQDKIEDFQLITTPRLNQSATHDISPKNPSVINSSRSVALTESSQLRNSARRTSDQHGNSYGAPLQSPVMSDAERGKRDKHRRPPQMLYKDACAMDRQAQPNNIFEEIPRPSGRLDDPIQLD